MVAFLPVRFGGAILRAPLGLGSGVAIFLEEEGLGELTEGQDVVCWL